MSFQRLILPLLGLLVLLGSTLVGCQQQPGAKRPATEAVVTSTPTVAPSPTPGERVFIEESYSCGPLFIPSNLGMYRLVLAWTPDSTHLVFNYLPVDEVARGWSAFEYTAIWQVDAAGSRLKMLVDTNPGFESQFGIHADISPDGTQVVYTSCEVPFLQSPSRKRGGYDYEVALIGLGGTDQRWLTKNSHHDHYPVWSPDGSRIAYLAAPFENDPIEIPERLMLRVMSADGSDGQDVAPIGDFGVTLAPPVWSPDGERLLFQRNTGEISHYMDLRSLYSVKADGSEMTLLAEEVVSVPAWSPDGQWLAVAKIASDSVANIAGYDVGIFILAADGSDLQLITTIFKQDWLRWEPTFNGSVPILAWSPDGTQILYSCLDAAACIIDLASGEVVLIESEIPFLITPHAAAWSPDGTRVAIFSPGDGSPPQLYTVASDGSNRHHLIRLDADGKLVPANTPQQSE